MEILFGGEEAEQIAKVAERKHGANVTEADQEKVEEDALPSNSSKEEIPVSSTKEATA